ncbi:MAG: hypothetical protein CL910_01160 [Deltaproteobacteria bacterium]|nr:hypothetical protein [Deltaproteobacteria bacterium]
MGTASPPAPGSELVAARSRAGEVRGIFSVLRAILAEWARPESLRDVVAPGLAPSAFRERMEAALAAEARCTGSHEPRMPPEPGHRDGRADGAALPNSV